MRRMMRRIALLLALLAAVGPAFAEDDVATLKALLNEFLAGATKNDAAVHERFWADDLIYTGSSGRRVGKADILKDVRSAPAPKAGDVVPVYTAEDVRVQLYGSTALVAFRLVSTARTGGQTDVVHYLNTGTFVRRDARWQAVGWQATRVPKDAKP
jgi:ketosteroid isomerase-like protein